MILDGKTVSKTIKDKVKEYINTTDARLKLSIVQVGNNPASNTYVKNKLKACEECNIVSNLVKIEDPDEYDRCFTIPYNLMGHDDSTALMLQLPLPKGWDEHYFLNNIPKLMDADCLTEDSLGSFYSNNDPKIAPCTAQGVMDLLDYYNIPVEGKRALVIGRSNIVGKPVAHLLTNRNATVTVAHSKTSKEDLLRLFATSHIVVSAVGKSDIISEVDADQYFKDHRHEFYNSFETISSDRVIIDVGINRDENGKLCGDFSEKFKEKYSYAYSPVPGGVGPLTVANLLYNTVKLHNMQVTS